MFFTIVLLFGLLLTPVATPVSIGNSPEWTVPLGTAAAVEPLLVDDVVIIAGEDRTVVALDVSTGNLRWSTAVPEHVHHSMTAMGDMVLLPGALGTLVGISVESGKVQNATSLGANALTRPVVMGNQIVISDVRGTVFIVNAESFTVEKTVVLPDGTGEGEAVGDLVVYATADGSVTAVDVQQAVIAWQAVMSASASLVRATIDGDVFVGLSSGDLALLSGSDGTMLWQQIHTEARLSDVTFTGNEIVAITMSGDALAINRRDGALLWQDVLPASGWFAAERCDSNCVFATHDGMLNIYSVTEMDISARWVLTGGAALPPVANDMVAIVVSSRGDVGAWSLASD